MATYMNIYTVRRMREISISLGDKLIPDQDYDFYGLIVDMSRRRGVQPSIPEKPTLEPLPIFQATISSIEGKEVQVDGYSHFLFPLSEFKKLQNMELSQKNKAIIDYLVAITGQEEQFAFVELS